MNQGRHQQLSTAQSFSTQFPGQKLQISQLALEMVTLPPPLLIVKSVTNFPTREGAPTRGGFCPSRAEPGLGGTTCTQAPHSPPIRAAPHPANDISFFTTTQLCDHTATKTGCVLLNLTVQSRSNPKRPRREGWFIRMWCVCTQPGESRIFNGAEQCSQNTATWKKKKSF